MLVAVANALLVLFGTASCLAAWWAGWTYAPMGAFIALVLVLHAPFLAVPLGMWEGMRELSGALCDAPPNPREPWSATARGSLARPMAALLAPQVLSAPILVWAVLRQEQIGTFALVVGVVATPVACLTGWLFLAHDLLADMVQDLGVGPARREGPVSRALHLGGNALAKGALVYVALFVCSMQPPFATGISIALFVAGLNLRRIHDRFRDLDDVMRVRAHHMGGYEDKGTGWVAVPGDGIDSRTRAPD